MKYGVGKILTRIYYFVSPPIANLISKNYPIKWVVRHFLDIIEKKLMKWGY